MTLPIDLIRPREITGMSAILLPMVDERTVDWRGVRRARRAHRGRRTRTPAVNMDTGYAHLLDARDESARAGSHRQSITGERFVAGAFDVDEAIDICRARRHAGCRSERADRGRRCRRHVSRASPSNVDRFIGFELSPVFHPAGRIWDVATYKEVLHIEACIGAKHSSLQREPEWDRLRLRDASRPDFLVLTGNDLAIDMVMYGSDYLLGLSTFAPDLFAERDRFWADGDPRFYALNDALQHLGNVAFRPPVPAYRHSAAVFLQLRGWITSDATPPGVPRRPDFERDLMRECGERLGVR